MSRLESDHNISQNSALVENGPLQNIEIYISKCALREGTLKKDQPVEDRDCQRRYLKPKYLIVKGCAGLGNRFHTLNSAINYSRKTQRILVVDWSDGYYGAQSDNVFPHYFNLKHLPSVRQITDIPALDELACFPSCLANHSQCVIEEFFSTKISSGIKKKALRVFPQSCLPHERLRMLHGYFRCRETQPPPSKSIKYITYIRDIFDKDSLPLGRMLSHNHPEEVVYFADYEPRMENPVLLEHLELTPAMQSKIEVFAQAANLGEQAIGVHVRHTDIKPRATLDVLACQIRALQARHSMPKIFLATDNAAVVQFFKSQFDQMVEYPKVRPNSGDAALHTWASRRGEGALAQQILEESIMDMWLLSKCRYLIYQSNSSFSKFSALLHADRERVMKWS